MSIAFRYVSREWLAILVVTALVLLLITLGGRFTVYLQDAALGKHSADSLLRIIALRVPEFLQLTLPFAAFIALVLTTARLYADEEMTVLRASGLSPWRVLLWIAPIAALVAGIVAVLALVVTPRANETLERLIASERAERAFETLLPGVFHSLDDGRRVTYSEGESPNGRELARVFIAETHGGRDVTVWADRGSQYVDGVTGSRFLLLHAGRRYEGTVGRLPYRVVSFATLGQRIERHASDGGEIELDALPTNRLRRDEPRAAAEFHWRLAPPLLTLIALPLGFALSRGRPREGRFARIAPAVLVFLAYYVALLLNRNALAEGELPGVVGLWPTHAAFVVAGVLLLRRISRPRPS